MNLENRAALVLGAGRGEGRTIAESLAAAGAFVACFDFSPMHAEQTAVAIRQAGGRARAYSGDVIKKIAFQTVINQVTDDFGEERLDILVSAVHVAPQVHMLRLDEWDWHRGLDSNLTLPFLAAQVVGRIMQTHGGGVMLFVGRSSPYPESVVYHAGKMGLLGLARHAAQALAPYHIRVHLLWPDAKTAPPEARPAAEVTPFPVGQPWPVGQIALWLVDPAQQRTGLILRP